MKEQWKAHLIETGEIDKLKNMLKLELAECGWRDQMKMECRDIVQKVGPNKITVEELVGQITDKGRKSVPAGVKEKMLGEIRKALRSENKQI